jgi:sugar phosphate isomerase/epimerase
MGKVAVEGRVISVSSIAFDGYSLEAALDAVAAMGVTHVEPASVDKAFQHLVEGDFCPERAAWLRRELAARRLACLSLSAHMDLTQPDSVDRFSRRLEFAAILGASCVSTIAGPAQSLAAFSANIAMIARRAQELGVRVGLENHGDLLDRGHRLVQFIRNIDHPAIGLTYDTGNAWYYSGGVVDPIAELREVASVVISVHLKNPLVEDGTLRWAPLGEGLLDPGDLGAVLRETVPGVPVTLDASLRQRSRNFEQRWRTPEIPSLAEIRGFLSRSLDALTQQL